VTDVKTNPPFGLTFSNIPLINLREEFQAAHEFVNSSDAEEYLAPRNQSGQIETTLLTWVMAAEDFVTFMLQKSILGVEAYLPGALVYKSAELGKASAELSAKLHKPTAFGSKLYAENVYHRMPAAVQNEFSLKHHNQALYEQNMAFYKAVRNPLFHGKQLSDPKVEALQATFAHIAKLYGWIDSWFDPRKAFSSVKMDPLTINIPINFMHNTP